MRITINTENGELSAGSPPFTVDPSLSLSAFLKSEVAQRAKKTSSSRYIYSLWYPLGDDFLLGTVLLFHSDGYITSARLKIGTKKEKDDGIWSREVEDAVKQRHDAWLKGQIGSIQRRFPWGMISSTVDMHGYSAVVIVAYRQIDSETYYHDQRTALSKLANSRIASVRLIEDQLIIRMDKGWELLTRVLPDVIAGNETIVHNMDSYKDALAAFVGFAANEAEISKTEEIIMRFNGGKELRISLGKYKGRNERAILTGPTNYRFIF